MNILDLIKNLFGKKEYVGVFLDTKTKTSKNKLYEQKKFPKLKNFGNFKVYNVEEGTFKLSEDLFEALTKKQRPQKIVLFIRYDKKQGRFEQIEHEEHEKFLELLFPNSREQEPESIEQKAEIKEGEQNGVYFDVKSTDQNVLSNEESVNKENALTEKELEQSDVQTEALTEEEKEHVPVATQKDLNDALNALRDKEIQEIYDKLSKLTELEGCCSRIEKSILNKEDVNKLINDIVSESIKHFISEVKIDEKLGLYAQKTEIEELNTALSNQKTLLKKMEEGLEDLRNNKASKDELQELGNTLNTLSKNNEQLLTVFKSSEVGKLHEEIKELKTKNIQVNKKLEGKEKELKDSQERNNDIVAENEEKKKEIEILTATKEEQENKIKTQKKELQDSQIALSKTQKELNKANEKIGKQNKKIVENNKLLEAKEKDIADRDVKIAENKKNIESQQKTIDTLTEEKNNLKIDIKTLSTKNDALQQDINNDSELIKKSFEESLENIIAITKEKQFILPCGDNSDDCEELEDMLEVKLMKFKKTTLPLLDKCDTVSSIMSTLTMSIENELVNDRSWVFDIARYRAYSRKRFMKDSTREHGVYFDKNKIVLMWDNLDKILNMQGFTLIMPDLFEDSVTEQDIFEDNTGQTMSSLDFLIPNNDKYLADISDNDGKIIRDYAEIGYKYNGKVIKKTKIIR